MIYTNGDNREQRLYQYETLTCKTHSNKREFVLVASINFHRVVTTQEAFSNIVLSFCVYLFLNIVQKDVKSNQTVVNSLSVAICYCSENLCKPHCAFVLS